jgi:hypothetical protein
MASCTPLTPTKVELVLGYKPPLPAKHMLGHGRVPTGLRSYSVPPTRCPWTAPDEAPSFAGQSASSWCYPGAAAPPRLPPPPPLDPPSDDDMRPPSPTWGKPTPPGSPRKGTPKAPSESAGSGRQTPTGTRVDPTQVQAAQAVAAGSAGQETLHVLGGAFGQGDWHGGVPPSFRLRSSVRCSTATV